MYRSRPISPPVIHNRLVHRSRIGPEVSSCESLFPFFNLLQVFDSIFHGRMGGEELQPPGALPFLLKVVREAVMG